MAKDKKPGEYVGDSSTSAAAKGFFSDFAIWTGFGIALDLALGKIFKQSAAANMSTWVSDGRWKWDVGFGAVMGLIGAFTSYKKAEAAEAQHDQLTQENGMLRTQMAQTGEALTRAGLGIQQQQGTGHAAGIQARGSHADAVLSETSQELAR